VPFAHNTGTLYEDRRVESQMIVMQSRVHFASTSLTGRILFSRTGERRPLPEEVLTLSSVSKVSALVVVAGHVNQPRKVGLWHVAQQ
jgi:hypothetical protein